jgi:holin-like protein
MIESLAAILVLQLLGEITVQLSGAPIPGPVLGMLLLALILCLRGKVPERLRQTCQNLLAHLALLFVPAGVGVMLHLERLSVEWLPLLAAIVLSTWLTLAVTAWVMQSVIRWQNSRATAGGVAKQVAHHE